MEIIILIMLLLVAALLFALEIFVLPGITLAGLGATVTYLYAFYYAFTAISPTAGLVSIGIALCTVIGAIVWFMKSKTIERLSLKKTLDAPINPIASSGVKIGDEGTSVTKLSLIGKARFNDTLVEVHSEDGFINEKTLVRITRIANNTIYVCAIR